MGVSARLRRLRGKCANRPRQPPIDPSALLIESRIEGYREALDAAAALGDAVWLSRQTRCSAQNSRATQRLSGGHSAASSRPRTSPQALPRWRRRRMSTVAYVAWPQRDRRRARPGRFVRSDQQDRREGSTPYRVRRERTPRRTRRRQSAAHKHLRQVASLARVTSRECCARIQSDSQRSVWDGGIDDSVRRRLAEEGR